MRAQINKRCCQETEVLHTDEKVMYMIRVLNYSPTKENYMRSNLELKVPYVFNSAEQSHEWETLIGPDLYIPIFAL